MTAKELNDRLGLELNDPNMLRFVDTTRINAINDTITEITNLRPDALISSTGALRTITAITSLTSSSTVSIADKFLQHILKGAAAKCFAMEAGDKRHDGKARLAREEFMFLIQNV